VLLDPTDPPSTGSDDWAPAPEPSAAYLAIDGVRELLRTPAEQARAVRAMLRGPRRALAQATAVIAGAVALGRNLQPTPTLSIEGAIGPHRRWASAGATLDDLKAIRSALGGTVNDVILSVVAGAFRDLMVSRGDPVDGTLLRTLVPVSVRAPDDHTANNQVSVIIAQLPVGVADPVERLAATRRQMDQLKGSHQAEAGEVATTLAGFVPPTLYALALRSASASLRRFPQRSVHTVTTNVPGPREALSALGREMVEYLPFVPLSQGTRIGVAILSYNGQVRFGVTGDYDAMPDVDWFCSRIETGVAELLSRSGVRRRHAKASRTSARAGRAAVRRLTAVPTGT
jgi:WS/DGAT/MGAT family acyltransferase